jgi:transcriptional regulator with XRE-family HTH domain
MTKKINCALSNLRGFRDARGENQSEFWSRFGVTQSGGSRYESGRALPKAVAVLLIAFVDGLLDDATLRRLVKAAGKFNTEA